ncbi:MAG: ribosome biogenesis/translation initiation ATPase RLI [Candidatus Hydrothermarchaeaceae archaeon]
MRIAVVDFDRCQPKKCMTECVKYCPGVRIGDETVVLNEKDGKPVISEELCSGCGICIKKCPFRAISIIGLADELEEDIIHQYGPNSFRLFRLPYPAENSVTGLIGQNGIGKTTIVNILAGRLTPNLGNLEESSKERVIEYFSGTQFQDYFSRLYEGSASAVYKPQCVDSLPQVIRGKVGEILEDVGDKGSVDKIASKLELLSVLGRGIKEVSGGELQRVAIAASLLKEGDVYIFDEPSSYLDVRQRLNVGKIIRELAKDKRVIVVEHDLIVLDYLADYINVIYGKAGAYGIVSHPRVVRQGINVYLDGYMREENIRFRKEPVRFEVRAPSKGWKGGALLKFENLKKSYNGFVLNVKGGEISRGAVVGVLGPNATGKTTFVKMLAGVIKPDSGKMSMNVKVSYKPQYIKPEPGKTVLEALSESSKISDEIIKPLELEFLLERRLEDLSGGELQKVAIASCLGRDADIYLLDEPSAYLDVEQRLSTAKMIRRVMEKKDTTGIVVDHDILFTDYISDMVMVFYGEPGVRGFSTEPLSMKDGMNAFLKDIKITFRRDIDTGRPRANKAGSRKDVEQKKKGDYYYQ